MQSTGAGMTAATDSGTEEPSRSAPVVRDVPAKQAGIERGTTVGEASDDGEQWRMHALSVGRRAVSVDRTARPGAAERIVPGRTMAAVENFLPARTLNVGDTRHRGLALRTGHTLSFTKLILLKRSLSVKSLITLSLCF